MVVIAEDLRAQLANLPDANDDPRQVRSILVSVWGDADRLAEVAMIPLRRQRFADPNGALRWVWTLDLPG